MNIHNLASNGAILGSSGAEGRRWKPRKISPFIAHAKRRKRAMTSGMRSAAERMEPRSMLRRRLESGSRGWIRSGTEGGIGRTRRVVRVGMEIVSRE